MRKRTGCAPVPNRENSCQSRLGWRRRRVTGHSSRWGLGCTLNWASVEARTHSAAINLPTSHRTCISISTVTGTKHRKATTVRCKIIGEEIVPAPPMSQTSQNQPLTQLFCNTEYVRTKNRCTFATLTSTKTQTHVKNVEKKTDSF